MISARPWLAEVLLACSLGVACTESVDHRAAPSAPPQAVSCAEDPDCLTAQKLGGTLYQSADASVAWARSFIGVSQIPPHVALGPAGELIATVGIATDARGLAYDQWLLSLAAETGELRWTHKLGPLSLFAIDTQGNILVARQTSLQKLDSAGNLLWSNAPAAAADPYWGALALDGDDNIVLARVEITPADWDADPTGLLRLEQLDEGGNARWSHQFGDGTTPIDHAYLTVDRDNNVLLLVTQLGAPVDFGGGPLMGTNVLAKYDSNGKHLFSKVIGGFPQLGFEEGLPLLSDGAGNIFLRMASYGELDLGLGPLSCWSHYMVKLDPTGTLLWNRCVFADAFALLPDGSWVTAATLSLSSKIGERTCGVAGARGEGKDGALARYDSTGAWITTSCAADPSYQALGNLAPDPSGMFFMTAAYSQQFTLPGGAKVADVGGATSLIAKVNLPP